MYIILKVLKFKFQNNIIYSKYLPCSIFGVIIFISMPKVLHCEFSSIFFLIRKLENNEKKIVSTGDLTRKDVENRISE